MSERALTDPAPVEDERPDLGDDVEDITPEPDPESHDIEAAVHGDRSTRTRVKVQPNGHLVEQLQQLAEEIDSYPTDDDVPDALIDEWVATKAEFDHIETYVVAGRNSDWLRDLAADLKGRGLCGETTIRRGMITPLPGSSEGEASGGGDYSAVAKRVLNMQIAAQSVKLGPLGQEEQVTADEIAALYADSEPEADKLFRAVSSVNTQPVKALMPDFSGRVSRLSRRG